VVNEAMPLSEVWARTFHRVQREIDIPTVWLAMQAVRPIAIDGNRFVATIPQDLRYLAMNLETSDTAHAIESALEEITGRPLAFLIIEGQTLEDWEAEKAEVLGTGPVGFVEEDEPTSTLPPSFSESASSESASTASSVPPPAFAPVAAAAGEGFDTWERLNEFIAHEQKHFPLIRYPHGQARYMLVCARMISGTMDRLMPGPGQPSDSGQERQLAKSIERLAANLSLDPFFVSLEVMRYRQLTGRE
jgi:hypothetical protein